MSLFPPPAPPPTDELSGGAIVGLVFAGIGALVISFGACYLVKDSGACDFDCCDSGSRETARDRAAAKLCPGLVSTMDALYPEQVGKLSLAFDEQAKKGAGREPGKIYDSMYLLNALHANLYGDGASEFGRRPNVSWTVERSALFFRRADIKGQGAIDFEDYKALFLRCRLEGEVAVATFTEDELRAEGSMFKMGLE